MERQLGICSPPFYFLRHGESANNQLDIVNGWTDCALSEAGREQARGIAATIGDKGIGIVYSSPLIRARETAEIVAAAARACVIVVEDLKERNWGVLESQPRSLVTDYFMVPEGAESWETYHGRVWGALSALPVPQNTLIVGHAGTMRVLRYSLGIGDIKSRIPNARLLRFEKDDGGAWSFCEV
ncbi:MAG: histidine phosphatase family protein [Alphaproteobacteria bacterium]|nr:histidine phosphatase family protein [Alphaproteobacteria bacterium]